MCVLCVCLCVCLVCVCVCVILCVSSAGSGATCLAHCDGSSTRTEVPLMLDAVASRSSPAKEGRCCDSSRIAELGCPIERSLCGLWLCLCLQTGAASGRVVLMMTGGPLTRSVLVFWVCCALTLTV